MDNINGFKKACLSSKSSAKEVKMRFPVLLLAFAFLYSCGKSHSRAGLPIEQKVLPANGSNIEGLYLAEIVPLNTQVSGPVTGFAALERRDDTINAYVKFSGGSPSTWHQQNIHEGFCPGMQDDMNGDGFIDIEEAGVTLGQILIPLDSNISTQKSGLNNYPISDSYGSYFYERTASFSKMFEDLKAEDTDPDDNIGKLEPDSGLDFEGKVVVIHGVSHEASIPSTVSSFQGRPAYQTLPIACGILKQVKSIPDVDSDNSAPVGEPPHVNVPDRPQPEIETPVEDTRWYDRIIDWWRNTWERERRGRRTVWGLRRP